VRTFMKDTRNEIRSELVRIYRTKVDPQLASAENVQIYDLARISDGWETDVYRFTIEYSEANEQQREDRILRIYPGNDAAQKSAHEFNVMKQLYAAGYPVPQVLRLETDGALFGKPFVIMERIRGRSMGAIVDATPREARREPLARFCRMFVDLHALNWRPFAPDVALHETQDPSAVFAQQLSGWQGQVHALRMHAFDPVIDWLSVRLPDIAFGPPSLLHMDYHHYNVLVREEDSAAFVIDWGGAMVADYRIDLAWTLLLMGGHGWAGARALILDEYERAAGRSVEQIEYFDVVACVRRLVGILAALNVGAAELGMRPGAEAMMKNAAHIEYMYALLRERTGIAIVQVERLLSTLR
jgi:aminoglycoside phosphotransferase (APT) family kinase protein